MCCEAVARAASTLRRRRARRRSGRARRGGDADVVGEDPHAQLRPRPPARANFVSRRTGSSTNGCSIRASRRRCSSGVWCSHSPRPSTARRRAARACVARAALSRRRSARRALALRAASTPRPVVAGALRPRDRRVERAHALARLRCALVSAASRSRAQLGEMVGRVAASCAQAAGFRFLSMLRPCTPTITGSW